MSNMRLESPKHASRILYNTRVVAAQTPRRYAYLMSRRGDRYAS